MSPGSFLLLVCSVSQSQSGPLLNHNLVDDVDVNLIDPSGHEDSSHKPRYINLITSISSWLNGLGWLTYGDYAHYLTFPDKSFPVYFNATDHTLKALAGNLFAVGVGAYLLSFLPAGTSRQGYGGDFLYDDYGLDRDLYSQYDYQYPDSVDDWKYPSSDLSYSSSKRKRVKSDRLGHHTHHTHGDRGIRAGGDRRRYRRRRRPVRRQDTGVVDNIAHYLLGPMERMGSAIIDPNTFLSKFVKSYDAYWQRRRGDIPLKSRRRSENAEFRASEDTEIDLPETEDVDRVDRGDRADTHTLEEGKHSEDWWSAGDFWGHST